MMDGSGGLDRQACEGSGQDVLAGAEGIDGMREPLQIRDPALVGRRPDDGPRPGEERRDDDDDRGRAADQFAREQAAQPCALHGRHGIRNRVPLGSNRRRICSLGVKDAELASPQIGIATYLAATSLPFLGVRSSNANAILRRSSGKRRGLSATLVASALLRLRHVVASL